MNDLVSVIITTYGRNIDILWEAIESVINQTYKNVEIIIIDDNGLNTEYQINNQKMVSGIQNVLYFANDFNQGVQYSRNRGIFIAKGEFVALLDDDDIWLPNKLERQLELINENNVGMVFCDGYIMENGNKIDCPRDHVQEAFNIDLNYETLLHNDYIGTTTQALIKKSAFIKAGLFDLEMPARQDYDMWLRISQHYKIVGVNEPLYYYRKHEGIQISKSASKAYIGFYNILHKHYEDFKKFPKAKARILLKMSRRKWWMKKPLNAIILFFQALFTSPVYFLERIILKKKY